MNNKTIGAILLVTSGACCTLGIVGAKIAHAIEIGMFKLSNGGSSPQRPELGWEIGIVVLVLAGLGFVFLFRDKRPE
jgi:hypothetical protein